MEGEIRRLIKVTLSVHICLSYCYFAGKIVSKGTPRLLTILPVVCCFLTLPLNLNSVHLIGPISFFISWLANFKLILFAIGKGPLSNPSISLPLFLAHACFPIKLPKNPSPKSPLYQEIIKNPSLNGHNKENPSPKLSKNSQKSLWNYGIKGLLLALFQNVYLHFNNSNPMVAWFFLGFSVYFTLELIVALSSSLVGFLFGLDLDPQFDEPFLSTSLQDFWGRRWNVMVTRILKPAVYDPVRDISARAFGRKWALLPAILSCFFVSGLMHELIFFYLGRGRPTWEMTMFFSLHGIFLVMEIVIKKTMNVKWGLPRIIATPLVVGFVMTTSYWLFRPEFLRCRLDVRAFEDYAAIGAFANDVRRALSLTFSH